VVEVVLVVQAEFQRLVVAAKLSQHLLQLLREFPAVVI